MITNFEAEILAHTSQNGRFVTDDPKVIAMGSAGLLFDHGTQALAGGAHYLVMTPSSRTALNEWRSAQPSPKKKRVGTAFSAWMTYRELYHRIPFSEFWRDVWPEWKLTRT